MSAYDFPRNYTTMRAARCSRQNKRRESPAAAVSTRTLVRCAVSKRTLKHQKRSDHTTIDLLTLRLTGAYREMKVCVGALAQSWGGTARRRLSIMAPTSGTLSLFHSQFILPKRLTEVLTQRGQDALMR
jgi:hypothetical protein